MKKKVKKKKEREETKKNTRRKKKKNMKKDKENKKHLNKGALGQKKDPNGPNPVKTAENGHNKRRKHTHTHKAVCCQKNAFFGLL